MLVYAFLLALLDPVHDDLREALLRFKFPRTGKRGQKIQPLLYRIRWALNRLWDDYRPRFTCFMSSWTGPFLVGSLLSTHERVQKNWG